MTIGLDAGDPMARWEDELNDALDDAVSNGEGRLTPYYLLNALRHRGFTIENIDESVNKILAMSDDQVKALALRFQTAQEAVAETHRAALMLKDILAAHDKKRLEVARSILELIQQGTPIYQVMKLIEEWLSYYKPSQQGEANANSSNS